MLGTNEVLAAVTAVFASKNTSAGGWVLLMIDKHKAHLVLISALINNNHMRMQTHLINSPIYEL